MSVAELMPMIGAGLTMALGALGLVRPLAAAKLVGVVPEGPRGRSEIRATYGGLFLGLGAACAWLQAPEAYVVGALAWLGAAGARVISIGVDRSRSRENLGGVGLEAAIGVMLLVGAL